jgi:hypothetical protein
MTDERFYSPPEIAKLLGTSPDKILTFIRTKQPLGGGRIGGGGTATSGQESHGEKCCDQHVGTA